MKYIDKPYHERQFLMIVDDDRGTANDSIDVFTPLTKPNGLCFGNQKMTLNTLYIAHPAKQGLYIPFGEHEIELITDKIHELSHLCLALGALSINIQWIKGRSVSEMKNNVSSFGGSASFGTILDSSFQNTNSIKSECNTSSNKSVRLTINSSAYTFPFVPKDLNWMDFESQWKQMVKARMLGAEDYSLSISSSNTSGISQKESENLVASLRVLKVKVGINSFSSLERSINNSEETEWLIKVKFRPLHEYQVHKESISNDCLDSISEPMINKTKKNFFSKLFKLKIK